MHKRKLLVANWKMNLSFDEAQSLLSEITGIYHQERLNEDIPIIFSVPFPYIAMTSFKMKDEKNMYISAQNISQHEEGAYTGEVSAIMIKSCGAKYTLVGHSERRQYFNESNEILSMKIEQCFDHDLTPIFCVGENEAEKKGKKTYEVLTNQFEIIANLSSTRKEQIIIAYEPVWAIGTGNVATPNIIQEVSSWIRSHLNLPNVTILYGGSLKPDNAPEIFNLPDIDGGLVGGASLKARPFIEIYKSFN